MSTKNHKPATTSDILPGTPAINPQIPNSNNSPPSPASPINPQIHKSNNPFLTTRARCGKVARLPKEIRDQLNEMILDGVPYAQIIQKLQRNADISVGSVRNADIPVGAQINNVGNADIPIGSASNLVPLDPANADTSSLSPSDGERAGVRGPSSPPDSHNTHHAPRNTEHLPASTSPSAPETSSQIENRKSKIEILSSLTPLNITNWKKFGGYRDWLKDQHRIEECKLRHELTLDLARSAEGLASYQAAPKVAVAQICQTIIDLGPEGLKEALKASPLNCFRLLNALARLINSGLKCEHQIQKSATKTTKERGRMTRARFERIERNLNLM